MHTRNRLLPLAIAALSLLPATGGATDCPISGFDLYRHAKNVGWQIGCVSRSLVTPGGTLIPMPTGELVCVGKMGLVDGTVDLVVTKPSYMKATSGSNLREGWFTKDWVEIPSTARSSWTTAKTHITYDKVRAGRDFKIGVKSIVMTKNGGNCRSMVTEIF